jgi:hypothetical protein
VLKFLKDKEGMIYTDSKYAFGVAHTSGKIWTERGLINSKGPGTQGANYQIAGESYAH